MEKKLLYFDEAAYKKNIAVYTKYINQLQDIYEVFSVMEFSKELTGLEFISLVNDTPAFVFDLMAAGGSLSIGGLNLEKHKAFDLLTKPKGYNELDLLIKTYKQDVNWRHYLELCTLNSGTVELSEKIVQSEKRNCSTYANSETELKIVEFIEAVKDKAIEIWGDNKGIDLGIIVTRLMVERSNHVDKSFKINYKAVSSFSNHGVLQ